MNQPHVVGARRQRWQLLRHVDAAVDKPLTVLALIWLVLLVIELGGTLPPSLQRVGIAIWTLFIIDFLLELLIAPARLTYLRRNWLTAAALILPAFRVLRIARAARALRAASAARSFNLVRVLARINRTLRALSRFFGRRGFGYVLATTIAVTFAGAAGMYALESRAALAAGGYATGAGGFRDFGDALWWTAMMMTIDGLRVLAPNAAGQVPVLAARGLRVRDVRLHHGDDRERVHHGRTQAHAAMIAVAVDSSRYVSHGRWNFS